MSVDRQAFKIFCMTKRIITTFLLLAAVSVVYLSCQKDILEKLEWLKDHPSQSLYDLNVILRGDGNRLGHIKFRQDADAAKIITLDTKVLHLKPNHSYLLQRAVDPINMVDGNCASTAWLTLGKGLELPPQPIITDGNGKGEAALWRDVTAIPAESLFDIHFQIIDAVSNEVVLTSDCYKYAVR